MKKIVNATTPLAGLRHLHPNDGILEVRLLSHDGGRPLAGYFDSHEAAANAIVERNGDPRSAYVTLNPISDSLRSRVTNRFGPATNGGQTKDRDIRGRQWLGIDIDSVRSKNQAATNLELKRAIKTRNRIVEWLQREFAWPQPLKMTSGNGAHALFPVDLPNTADVTRDVTQALKTLDAQFSSRQVKVDVAVANASRIWKVPGTWSRKGTDTHKRPHRRAQIEAKADTSRPVTLAQLQALGAFSPSREMRSGDVIHALKHAGLYRRDLGNGKHAMTCPWEDEHSTKSTDSETVVFEPNAEYPHGGFKCQHDHCAARTIADLKKRLRIQDSEPDFISLEHIEPKAVEYLWRPYIPLSKLTFLDGNPGDGKSHASLAIATSLSLGVAPGRLAIPRLDAAGHPRIGKTLIVSTEDDLADTVVPRLIQLGADRRHIHCWIKPLTLNDDGIARLDRALRRIRPELLIIDPLVSVLGAGVDMFRSNETRPVLDSLVRLASTHRCAIVCIRHLTKGKRDHALYRGQGSIDFAATSRSVLITGVNPQDPTERIIAQPKATNAKPGDSLTYQITDKGFRWTGTSALTADDLMAAPPRRAEALSKAADFLRTALADGPVSRPALLEKAEHARVSQRSLERATALRLVAVNKKAVGQPGKRGVKEWTWALADGLTPPVAAKRRTKSKPAKRPTNDGAKRTGLTPPSRKRAHGGVNRRRKTQKRKPELQVRGLTPPSRATGETVGEVDREAPVNDVRHGHTHANVGNPPIGTGPTKPRRLAAPHESRRKR